MHTTTQKANSIRIGSGILTIDGENVGLLENAELEVTHNILSKKAHNGPLPVRKKIESVKFKADLYEIDLETINKLDGHSQLSRSNGEKVTITSEEIGENFVINKPLKLANKNGNNSQNENITIKADNVSLTLDTDYKIFTQSDGYTYILPLNNKAGKITASYDFIPNANKKITFKDIVKLVSYYEVKFVNIDENGKEFSLTIPKAYNSANLTLGFNSDEEIESNMTMPVELTAYPNHNKELLILYDEQSV